MYIGINFKVVTKHVSAAHYHEEHFIDEKSARDYANRVYMAGAALVELWQRGRDGYRLVKRVKENQRIAEARYNAHIAMLAKEAEEAGCTITRG